MADAVSAATKGHKRVSTGPTAIAPLAPEFVGGDAEVEPELEPEVSLDLEAADE